MKIAVAQLVCKQGQFAENFRRIGEWIERASGRADLVIFPELFTTGSAADAIEKGAVAADSPEIADLAEASAQHNISVLFGAAERDQSSPEKVYNSAFLLTPAEGVKAVYRKPHLCPFQPFFENLIMQPGSAPLIAEIGGFKLGVTICFDLRFPELYRALAVSGCDLIAVISSWPRVRVKHWDTLLSARAIENQSFIAASNQSGSYKETVFAGRSRIIDPLGEVVVEAGSDSEELLIAEISPAKCAEIRKSAPVLSLRRPELYGVIKP